MSLQQFIYNQPFQLESGFILPNIEIAYHIYGKNKKNNKIIWVCHALTASSNVAEWWKGLFGNDGYFNFEDNYIICANIIGSCYGSTGPLSTCNNHIYYTEFPLITIRDMVNAHILLRKHLNIEYIDLLIGGSMGGYQVMEWAVMEPTIIKKMFLIATSASESAWGVAVHTAQRLAIEADDTWKENYLHAGAKGLKAARAIGMLTYRNYDLFQEKQTDPDPNKIDNFKASAYIIYQGEKLVNRFNTYSYWILTKAMDSHHLARNRGGNLIYTLQNMHQPTLIMGIQSDILCPPKEQIFISENLPNNQLVLIDSIYGHDGFLLEIDQIVDALKKWM